jgi:hypothetical protein
MKRSMPFASNNKDNVLRTYVLTRDKHRCQWPGCADSEGTEVLLIVESDGHGEEHDISQNGITLCRKHLEIVMLHEGTFAPLIYDIIRLVEFENDLKITEKTYKGILGE